MAVVERSTNIPIRAVGYEYEKPLASSDLNEAETIITNNVAALFHDNNYRATFYVRPDSIRCTKKYISDGVYEFEFTPAFSYKILDRSTGKYYIGRMDGSYGSYKVSNSDISTNSVHLFVYWRFVQVGPYDRVYYHGCRENEFVTYNEVITSNNIIDPELGEELSVRDSIEFTFVLMSDHAGSIPKPDGWDYTNYQTLGLFNNLENPTAENPTTETYITPETTEMSYAITNGMYKDGSNANIEVKFDSNIMIGEGHSIPYTGAQLPQRKGILVSGENNTVLNASSPGGLYPRYPVVAEGYSTTVIAQGSDVSHSEGYKTYAQGGHAEGSYATTSGLSDTSSGHNHAEGYCTLAIGRYNHAEGSGSTAGGEASHSEGYQSISEGKYSHAEGVQTTAEGEGSHTEGQRTKAVSKYSHAEGYYTTADASGTSGASARHIAHAEGTNTIATGESSHAEGNFTTASGNYSHSGGSLTKAGYSYQTAIGYRNQNKEDTLFEVGDSTSSDKNAFEVTGNGFISTGKGNNTRIAFGKDSNDNYGYYKEGTSTLITFGSGGGGISLPLDISSTSNVTGILRAQNGGTGNNSGYVRAGAKVGSTPGNYSTAEGSSVVASGTYSHAEGYMTTSGGEGSHAEGEETLASGKYSHAEGSKTTVIGRYSYAAGGLNYVEGNYSFAQGYSTTISGGDYNTVFGTENLASGSGGFVAGSASTVSGLLAFALGYNVKKSGIGLSIGSYNNPSNEGIFIIGDGNIQSSMSHNCFRVTSTDVYGGTYNTSGADYAEMFEWKDSNKKKEDRRGRFVTLDGNKIRLAKSSDDYILGIVSGTATVIGDTYEEEWSGQYEKDIYGATKLEEVVEELKDENGNVTMTSKYLSRVLSKDYNPEKTYTPRSQRPEWSAVGLIGKLVCDDDGTASPDDYVYPGDKGIATKSQERTKFRVLERLDDSHIKVMIL